MDLFKRNKTEKVDINAFKSLQAEVEIYIKSLAGINSAIADLQEDRARFERKLGSIDELSIKRDEALEKKFKTEITQVDENLKNLFADLSSTLKAKPVSKKPTRKR